MSYKNFKDFHKLFSNVSLSDISAWFAMDTLKEKIELPILT